MKAGPSASSGSMVHLSLLLAIFSLATPAPMVPEFHSAFSDVKKLTDPAIDLCPLSSADDTGPAIHDHLPPSPGVTDKPVGLVTNSPLSLVRDAQKSTERVTDTHPLPSPVSEPAGAAEVVGATQPPPVLVNNAGKTAELDSGVVDKAPEDQGPVTLMESTSKKRKVEVLLDLHRAHVNGPEQPRGPVPPAAHMAKSFKQRSAPRMDHLAFDNAKELSGAVTDGHSNLPSASDSQKLSEMELDSHPPLPVSNPERVAEPIDSTAPAINVRPMSPVQNTSPVILDHSPPLPSGNFKHSAEAVTDGETPLSPVSDAQKASELLTDGHPPPMPPSAPEKVVILDHSPALPSGAHKHSAEAVTDGKTPLSPVSDAQKASELLTDGHSPPMPPSAAEKVAEPIADRHHPPVMPVNQAGKNGKVNADVRTAQPTVSTAQESDATIKNAQENTGPASTNAEDVLEAQKTHVETSEQPHGPASPELQFSGDGKPFVEPSVPSTGDHEEILEPITDSHPPVAVNNAENAKNKDAHAHTAQPTVIKASESTAQPTISMAPESDATVRKAPENSVPEASRPVDARAQIAHVDKSEQPHGTVPPETRASENDKQFLEPSASPTSDPGKVSDPATHGQPPLEPVDNSENIGKPNHDVDAAQPTVSEGPEGITKPTVSKASGIPEPEPAARSSSKELEERFGRMMNVKPKPPPVPARPSVADHLRRYWSRVKELFAGLGAKIKRWWFRRSEESTARGIDLLQSRAKPKGS